MRFLQAAVTCPVCGRDGVVADLGNHTYDGSGELQLGWWCHLIGFTCTGGHYFDLRLDYAGGRVLMSTEHVGDVIDSVPNDPGELTP